MLRLRSDVYSCMNWWVALWLVHLVVLWGYWNWEAAANSLIVVAEF